MSAPKKKGKLVIVVTRLELLELVNAARRLAGIYGFLGYPEDKESLYRFIKVFEDRLKEDGK